MLKRSPLRVGTVGLLVDVVALLSLAGVARPGFTPGPPQADPTPPLPPASPLGHPTGLTAAPGARPGDIALRWTPAANAAFNAV